jgi:hypothetical protein
LYVSTVQSDRLPGFLDRNAADVELRVSSDLIELEGHAVARAAGGLAIAPPRELIVERAIRAAFNPDGTVASDTPRYTIVENVLAPVDDIPEARPDSAIAEVIEDPVVWGGAMTAHFGHFLLESVSRLWPLLPGGELEGLPVVFATPGMTAFAAEWIGAFGVEVIDLPDAPVRFTNVHVPEPAWVSEVYTTPEFRKIHQHARKGLDMPRVDDQGPLWLGRAKVEPTTRRTLDEAAFEWFVDGHLTVVHPEELSLAEQVARLEASSGVAGVIGSAFHALVLVEKPPPTLYLCPHRIPSPFAVQDHLLGARGTFVRGLAFEKTRMGPGRQVPHRLMIPETLRALDSLLIRGLLSDRALGTIARPERLASGVVVASKTARPKVDAAEAAMAALVIQPHGYGPRVELGDLLESEGAHDAALEQYRAATELGEDRWYGRVRVARLLAKLGRAEEAADAARRVLELEPRNAEAIGYIAAAEAEAHPPVP